MFRPFWVGFPYFSLPFGVTAPRRKQVAELNCRSKISHQKRKPAQSTCIGTWMSQEVSKRLESGLYFQYTQFISIYNYRLLPIDPNHFILTSNIPSNGTCWQDSARNPNHETTPRHRSTMVAGFRIYAATKKIGFQRLGSGLRRRPDGRALDATE